MQKLSNKLSINALKKKLKVPNKNIVNKIKIQYSLFGLILVVTITFLTIGMTSMNTMQEFNRTIDDFHHKSVQQLIAIDQYQNAFNNIKFNVSHGIKTDMYYEYDNNIEPETRKIEEMMKTLEEMSIGEKKMIYINRMNDLYSEYITLWEKYKTEGQSDFSQSDRQKFSKIESEFKSSLEGIIKLNDAEGENRIETAEQLYNDSVRMNLTIIILSIAIILFIIIGIIWLLKRITKNTSNALENIAKGNLGEKIENTSNNEFSKMLDDMEYMRRSLKEIIKTTNESTEATVYEAEKLESIASEMSNLAEKLSIVILEVSSKSKKQLSNLDEMNGEIKLLDEIFTKIDFSVDGISDLADKSKNMAEESSQSIFELAETLPNILKSFNSVGREVSQLREEINSIDTIIEMIDKIADQTSLLALNARIEAARAGEAGKGFIVVAEEISKLSSESKTSAGIISEKVQSIANQTLKLNDTTKDSTHQLKENTSGIESTLQGFQRTIDSFNDILPEIKAIHNEIVEGISKKDLIVEKSNKIKNMLDDTTQLAGEASNHSDNLAETAIKIEKMSKTLNEKSEVVEDQLKYFKL